LSELRHFRRFFVVRRFRQNVRKNKNESLEKLAQKFGGRGSSAPFRPTYGTAGDGDEDVS
jgi:hypothetical protein